MSIDCLTENATFDRATSSPSKNSHCRALTLVRAVKLLKQRSFSFAQLYSVLPYFELQGKGETQESRRRKREIERGGLEKEGTEMIRKYGDRETSEVDGEK